MNETANRGKHKNRKTAMCVLYTDLKMTKTTKPQTPKSQTPKSVWSTDLMFLVIPTIPNCMTIWNYNEVNVYFLNVFCPLNWLSHVNIQNGCFV